ncbi:serine/threonine-protein kinase [Streptomyces cavernicola]|uniref:non-specific serine/threonine protein kinase n=1 Tax=Streptomyces cavernicola TaxID=3043613 RepID=A0ABT6SCY5_9ACTN|nr:serine/threonine-protein kinase [Streptomyces sp. B-S-A6]MDI3405517.1 serine/threonine-protein kinase [Streptomyces sp. B-S-A6]
MASASERGNSRLIAGRYRLGEQLGRGGMGVVWRATDELLARQVAVKEVVLDPSLSFDEARRLRERTLREARTIAQIHHPHVIVVYDVLVQDGRPYIVMELIEGGSLADRLDGQGPLGTEEAARLCLALLGALRAAHGEGVLHRDLKPGNVLTEAGSGRVVLTDFGIAQVAGASTLTEHGSFVGSPEYTAPERMSGGAAGPGCDLWSLGVLLCAALTGRSPFQRDTLGGIVTAVMSDELDLPGAAGPLLPVVRGLLERDPERRIDAAEAERLLRAYVQTGVVPYAPQRRGFPAERRGFPPALAPLRTAAQRLPTPGPRRPAGAGAGAGAGAPSGSGVSAGSPRRLPRARAALLAGVLVAVVAGAGAAAAVLLFDGGADRDDGRPHASETADTGGTGGTPTPTVTVTRVPTGTGSAPAGYRLVHDPAGFALAVPEGYVRTVEPPRVFYASPGGAFRIGVREADPVPGGPAAALREAHGRGPRTHAGYRAGALAETRHDGRAAARWEFTWDGPSDGWGPRHELHVAWEEGGRMHEVSVSAPVGRAREAQRHLDRALGSFTRDPAG